MLVVSLINRWIKGEKLKVILMYLINTTFP